MKSSAPRHARATRAGRWSTTPARSTRPSAPRSASEAERAKGNRARISFHEEERNGFHNVYLDAVEPVSVERPAPGSDDADEVAWGTAVEAAPWLLGTPEPDEEISPDELYEKLEPFKRRVAEDIREEGK